MISKLNFSLILFLCNLSSFLCKCKQNGQSQRDITINLRPNNHLILCRILICQGSKFHKWIFLINNPPKNLGNDIRKRFFKEKNGKKIEKEKEGSRKVVTRDRAYLWRFSASNNGLLFFFLLSSPFLPTNRASKTFPGKNNNLASCHLHNV